MSLATSSPTTCQNIRCYILDSKLIFPPSVIDFTNETAFFLWWFVCDGRANYKIMTTDGKSCVFTQTLKYGSSYTLVVRPDITFGDQVTREFRVCKKAFFIMVSDVNVQILSCSAQTSPH